ncbi:MAG: acyltransferase family protein [Jatrophihabitans sp.]
MTQHHRANRVLTPGQRSVANPTTSPSSAAGVRARHAEAAPPDDDRLPNNRNSLNAIRLVLALVVVVSHVPKIRGGDPIAIGDLEIGGWAVAGFFALSGWLVTQSRLRLSMGRFLWRRALRIFPGFWACLLTTAFVAAPISAILGPGSWRPITAARYVFSNIALYIAQPTIGNSLAGRPDTTTWNLSLWTLSYEFACYLGIGLLLSLAVARRRPAVTAIAFVAVVLVHAVLVYGGTERDTTLQLAFRLASFFLAGAFLRRFQNIRLTMPGAIAALVILAFAAHFGQVRVLAALPMAYLCLWLARVLPFHKLGRRNDISYGMYVYAFPVQQLLTYTPMAKWHTIPLALLSMAAVTPLAFLSWRFIEQPTLRFKSATWPSRNRRISSAAPR